MRVEAQRLGVGLLWQISRMARGLEVRGLKERRVDGARIGFGEPVPSLLSLLL